MLAPPKAFQAYRRVHATRTPREQEAEVFAIAAGRMRLAATDGTDMDRVRARADARRLFMTLRLSVMDPANQLPVPLRASIVSVCDAALREVEGGGEETDFEFLAGICDDFRAGLSTPVAGSAA
jgi:flagellar biosynthesis regulator FlaF